MNDELKKVNQKLVEMNKKNFAESFEQFKDFNNFDDFVENSTQEGNKKLCGELTSEEFETFDINKSLLENMKNIILKQTKPNLENVKLNMAKMFAYNLDKEVVKNTIKCDTFCFETIKKELIESELFEQIEKLNNIKNE
jgi:ribosomal protein S17E